MSILEARHLGYSYGETRAVDDVAISLSPGEVVALIGPNGSGKSTLTKLLLGHLRGAGEVKWEGRPLERWSPRELARRVAYLPQSPLADAGQTVLDVLKLGRLPYLSAFGLERRADIEAVKRVSDLLELTEFWGRPMSALSGGQRQRVFVGRCLAQEPAAMLLDEPNTYLDLRHQLDLSQLLRGLSRDAGLGVLMASHDLNLAAALADRLVLMDKGRAVAEGSPHTVLDPELLSRVYQIRIERTDRAGKSPLVFPVIE